MKLDPDAEQRWLLDQIFAEDADGYPTAYEVAVVAPRQNLKSAVLEVAALTDLFVVGVPLAVWTAHEFKTARKAFEDMRQRIRRHPHYDARASFRDSHGEEAIFLDTGERLEFHARSGGSGRGFTCDRLTLDEAMFLQPGDLGALVPTMFTVADGQIRYGSSAGKTTSGALREIRERGRAGSGSLAYVEYGAERRDCADDRCLHKMGTEGCALDDRDLWWQANCALWAGRATEESVLKQRRALPPDEFAREFLSWWDDPGGSDAPFGIGRWEACAEAKPTALTVGALAVAVSLDLTFGAICAAGDDGHVHVKPLEHQPGIGWIVDRAKALQAAHRVPVVVDGRGPAAVLIPLLERAGVRLVPAKSGDVFDACAGILDLVREKRLRHGSYPELDAAVAGAVKHNVGDRWVWARKFGDISPLEAATLAAWAVTGGLVDGSVYDRRGMVSL